MTTVQYNIVGHDRASKAFNSVARSSSRLEKSAGLAGSAVKKAGIAAGAGILALGAVAKKGVTLYADFDATLRQVGIQTKSSTKGLEKLAIKLGQDTVFSAKDAAAAMLELAKSGLSAADIQGGALASTLKLASAGGLELADSATYMADSMHAFGLKTKDSNAIVTALAGGANASSISVQDLGLSLAQSASGARNAGLTLNDTVSVLAALGNAGIKGSDAGTSLKVMLQRLIPTTKKSQTTMDKLGISFTNSNGSFKSIAQISQILHDKLGHLTAAQKAQALQQIFGSDATRAATVLMREGAKGINKYEKATKDSGTATKLANSRMSGLSGAIENLKGSAETTMIVIGKALAPAVTAVAKVISGKVLPAVQSFVASLQDADSPARRLAESVAAFVRELASRAVSTAQKLWAVFGPLVIGLAKSFAVLPGVLMAVLAAASPVLDWMKRNATLVRTLAVGIGAVVGAFYAWNIAMKVLGIGMRILGAAMAVNPFFAIVLAVVGLAAALIYAYKHSKTFRNIVNAVFRAVKTAAMAFVGFFTTTIPNAFKSVIGYVKDHWRGIVQIVLAPFLLIPVLIWKYFGPIKAIFSTIIGGVVGAFHAFIHFFTNTIPDAFKTAVGYVKDHWQGITQIILAPILPIPMLIWRYFGPIKAVFTTIANSVVTGFHAFIGFFTTTIPNAFRAVVGYLQDHWRGITQIILGPILLIPMMVWKYIGPIKGIFSSVMGGVMAVARSVGHWFGTTFPGYFVTAYHTVISAFSVVGSWFKGMPARIGAFFAGGSKWLLAKGSALIGGLWGGIAARWAAVRTWFAKMGARIVAFFAGSSKWLISRGREVVSGLWSGVSGFWTRTVAPWFGRMFTRLSNFFRGAGTWLTSRGRSVVSGLWTGISKRFVDVASWWGRMGARIKGYFKGASSWLTSAGRSILRGLAAGFTAGLNGLGNIFRAPLNWIISNVINKFIGLLNKIPGVDIKTLGTIKGPAKKAPKDSGGGTGGGNRTRSLATGGMMPGYSPGRDIHTFYSPTGGVLNLAGGEPVMRPEFGRVVGKGWVDTVNAAARHGGIGGVRKALGMQNAPEQSHLFGGIIKDIGKFGGWASSKVKDGAEAINPLPLVNRAFDSAVGGAFSVANKFANRTPTDFGKQVAHGVLGAVKTAMLHNGHADAKKFELGAGGGGGGKFLAYARKYKGQPYVWGGAEPGGFDCSGLTSTVMNHFGLHSPRTASAQEAWASPLSKAAARGGDLIFYGGSIGRGGAHHVAFNEGGGRMFEAQQTGTKIGSYPIRGGAIYGRAPGAGPFLGGVGGGAGGGALPGGTSGAMQAYAKSIMTRFGWLGDQWNSLKALWQGESNWNPNAQNPTSTAYGIAQFLDSTWRSYGPKTANWKKQIDYGEAYVHDSYDSPNNAYSKWMGRSPHWYRKGLAGGLFRKPTLIGVGDGGPERVDVTPLSRGRSGIGSDNAALAAELAEIKVLLAQVVTADHRISGDVKINGLDGHIDGRIEKKVVAPAASKLAAGRRTQR